MASVKVAVRVRPMNKRETDMESKFIITMDGKKTRIINRRFPSASESNDQGKERVHEFTYDHSYWTVDRKDSHFASQAMVYRDLGKDVIASAYEGYNACVFAYGQTGSGKTYTMMGNPGDKGLIPRICENLFAQMADEGTTYRTEVSYLEIYNEKVRDLLRPGRNSSEHSLRVREHPKEGPYVQDLSKHIVINYDDIEELMERGNNLRTTASTNMNDVSSRSHAIFTIVFTQAKFSRDTPSETKSKIHLVDLAGSERADATGATGQRLKESGSINKSLVTLGNVISSLADLSEKSSSKKQTFIPYRDSVLTWLLKDSLGGNAKTIMIATLSPAECNYGETLSTLRYANRAKNIINKPTINEDQNVRLIRELRMEIARLKALLGGNIDNIVSPRVQEKLHENEARVKVLTEEWAGKWKEAASILKEDTTLALRKEGLGVVLDSELPHLIGIDDDILSTGIMLYHLKEGKTNIGTDEADTQQDIVLSGVELEGEHCIIAHTEGKVMLHPIQKSACTVNGTLITEPTKLTQGAVILLGKTNMFRFNHPAEAAKLRKEMKSGLSMSRMSLLSQSFSDLTSMSKSTDNLAGFAPGYDFEITHREEMEKLESKRQQIEEMEERFRQAEEVRLAEQDSKEKDIDSKRRRLEEMQDDAEKMREEAEKMCMEAQAEKLKLKRRSMDIEKQLQTYLEEKEKLQESIVQGRLKIHHEKQDGLLEGLKQDEVEAQRKVQAELRRLGDKETAVMEEANSTRFHFQQEQEELERRRHAHEDQLASRKKQLTEQEEKLVKQREEGQVATRNKVQKLQQGKEKALQAVEDEKKMLTDLQEQYTSYEKVLDLSEEDRQKELDKLQDQEILAAQSFSDAELEITEARKALKDLIGEERQKLTEDKNKLNERLQKCQELLDNGEEKTEKELEELEQEKKLISEEQQRLELESSDLISREKEAEESLEKELALAKEKKDKEDKVVSEMREKLSDIEATRSKAASLEEKMVELTRGLAAHQCEIQVKEQMIQELRAQEEEREKQMDAEVIRLQDERETLADLSRKQGEKLDKTGASLSKKRAEFDAEVKEELDKIQQQKEKLSALEQKHLEELAKTAAEIKQQQGSLDKMQNQGESAEKSQRDSTVSDDAPPVKVAGQAPPPGQQLEEEWGQLETRLRELQALEEQYQRSEQELEEKRRKFEDERLQELDKIDFEKYRLHEMEQQERINMLVEQEVKRRLFEERVQREKQRRIEREKEKKERELELLKIRRQHDKELERLKQEYNKKVDAWENVNPTPTRANPYASVHSGDSISIGSPVRRIETPRRVLQEIHENPIQVSIPTFVLRGSGFDAHYEFEVKVQIYDDVWSVYRRYSKFREMHLAFRVKYSQVAGLEFPPKRWFGNRLERVVVQRRKELENYLQSLIHVCMRIQDSPINPTTNKCVSKQALCEFSSFFRKGLFESSKHGTG